jgi:Flp pilus assembly protein TadD
MRPQLLLLPLLLLAACSSGDKALSRRAPGLDVADVALASGAPETALHIAQQVLATDPRNEPALVRMGNAQAALGQRDQAAFTFRQALAIAPGDAAAALGLARLQLAMDPTAAVGILLRLTTQNPRNVAALIDLGIARDLLGQHAEAQASYRQALRIDAGNTAGTTNLGLSLALSGDPQQALTILRPLALAPGASSRTRQDLAVALSLAGDDDGAAAVLRTEMAPPAALASVTDYHALRATP